MHRYRKSFLPLMTSLRCSLKPSANLRPVSLINVHCRWTFVARHTVKYIARNVGKMSGDVNMPFGCLAGVIVDDEWTWGHVRQTVLLQGKIPGDWSESFRGRLLLTSRSFSFLAHPKSSVVFYWRYCLKCSPHEGSGSFPRNQVPGLKGIDKRYSIISVVFCSVTFQNLSPWFGQCSFFSRSTDVIRIPACCKKGSPFLLSRFQSLRHHCRSYAVWETDYKVCMT